MEKYKHKLFFVFLLISLSAVYADVSERGLTVLASSGDEYHFVQGFDSEVTDLEWSLGADSLIHVCKTISVGIPFGARVKLIAAQGHGHTASTSRLNSNLSLAVDPLVRISRPISVRGRQFVNVRICPATSTGLYSSVNVHLAFEHYHTTRKLAPSNDPRFEPIFRTLLINYEMARGWPVASRSDRAALSQGISSFPAADQWYKVGVNETGLICITGAELETAGISLSNLLSSEIRIYYGGGLVNPVDNAEPRPTFDELPVLVLDGDDGVFNYSDQIVFFGEAVDRWRHRPDSLPEYVNNPYESMNVYWLAVGGSFGSPGLRMTNIDGSIVSVDEVVTTFWRRVHIEQDSLLARRSGDGRLVDYYNWYWSDETSQTLFATTPGAITGDSADIIVVANTGGDINLTINGVIVEDVAINKYSGRFTSYSLDGGQSILNQFDMDLMPISVSKEIPPYLNYVEIIYHSRLEPANNRLDIVLDNHDAVAELRVIDNFASTPLILDLSDPRYPQNVTGFLREGGLVRFAATLTSAGPNRFYCQPVSQASSPVSIAPVNFTDLDIAGPQTDLIIITTRSLQPHLGEYIAYRQNDGYSIQTVTVEDIMDNFSCGLYDPTAIRDFLKYAYESENYPGPPPSAVLFVGDANYDFLDHTGSVMSNFVPAYIHGLDGSNTASDDNYVYFGDYGLLDGDDSYDSTDRGFDMMTARWPVRSVAEIDMIVSKIQSYETVSHFGSWRSNVTLVADDEFGDRDNEDDHTRACEILDDDFIPPSFTRNKIYAWEYPLVGREKPEVTEAIVDAFNDGTLIVNYVGHGNPDVWAHERILKRTSDLPQLVNASQLPLVYAASCAIGFFDDPRRECMGEDFLTHPGGGAIAIISATRLVNSPENARLNQAVFDVLLKEDSLSIGEAFFVSKLRRQLIIGGSEGNDRAYTMFGGPYVKLAMPRLMVVCDTVPDSLVAMERSRVVGRVIDDNGATVESNGTLLITAYDSDRETVHMWENTTDTALVYDVPGPVVFRGSASIIGGEFAFEFITPLDIGYGGTGARISVYAMFDSIDGAGADSIPVSFALIESSDSTGPEIAYSIVGRSNFVSGDLVGANESLVITISDSSGINISEGLAHGIRMIVDNQVDETVNLTSLFEYETDSYTSGTLAYGLDDLASGLHRLKIEAWDNANNLSVAEFTVEVVTSGNLAIEDLLNYPNPMDEQTTFYFALTQPAERFTLEIFTLSGRKIWNSSYYDLAADYYPNDNMRMVWSGRDAVGDRVATGVYIYKATATRTDGGDRIEKFGKLVLVN